MGVQVRFSPGHDIYYLPAQARPGGGGERTTGGYYVNAAQAGRRPGRWFGKGAAALGLAEGDEVDPAVHEMVFSQVDPRTGGRIGRGPGAGHGGEAGGAGGRAGAPAGRRAARDRGPQARAGAAGRADAPGVAAVYRFHRRLLQVGQRRPRLYQGKRPPGRPSRGPGRRGLLGGYGGPVRRDPVRRRRGGDAAPGAVGATRAGVRPPGR